MTASEALVALLTTDSGVSALIGTRVYPLLVPQDTTNPAVSWQQISLVPGYSHDGFASLSKTRYQLTIEGDTYAQVAGVALAVKRRFRGYRGIVSGLTVRTFIDNESDGYSDISGQSGVGGTPVMRVDVLMWHDEA